ncbi:MAG: MEDS domain-containing protein [Sphaerochaetaceae bacterium]|nr:MEDS domain-containing protein [Sphaerochaetaceae bacterium]
MSSKNILEEMKHIIPGDHMVLLYDETEDVSNIDVMVSYILSRLEKNEKCFYIKGDIGIELILKRLSPLIDLESYIKSNQLVISDKRDVYAQGGKFSPHKMIDSIKKLSEEAIEEGFSAFAMTGELSFVLEYENGFENIMEYEFLLNDEIFGSYPVSAICRYNITKFSHLMIKNIIEVHPLIIWKGQVQENPFYFEVVDTDNVDIERYQVESMLDTIVKFSSTKSRFRNEIENKEKQYQKLQLSFLKDIVLSLTRLLEIHDEYTKDHSQKVAIISKKIATEMGLSEAKILQVYYAGLVHDIGKIIIPKEIINKPGKLSDDEYDIVKKHPSYAYDVLSNSKELYSIANIVLQHHERWDGHGYPNGIKIDNIPMESRIIAVADSYDAMTSDRSYRRAFTKEEAIEEIKRNAGKQFDPDIALLAVERVFNDL